MNKKYFNLFLTTIFVLSSCGTKVANKACKDLFSKYGISASNSNFSISVPKHVNSFKLGDPVFLSVDNSTGNVVEVAPDTDIVIYWRNKDVWAPIKNDVNHHSVVDRLTSRSGDDPGGGLYIIDPNFEQKNVTARVCVILFGQISQNSSNTKLAAYTEFVLLPK